MLAILVQILEFRIKILLIHIFQVKPLLSVNEREARIRVFQLYKAWTRQLPDTIEQYTLPVTEKEAQQCLKENFMKNAHVKDIRVIDMLIIKVLLLIYLLHVNFK